MGTPEIMMAVLFITLASAAARPNFVKSPDTAVSTVEGENVLSFDVNVQESYKNFMMSSSYHLTGQCNKVQSHCLLPYQNKASSWALSTLKTQENGDTILAVGHDDVYFAGFSNRTGRWLKFRFGQPLSVPGNDGGVHKEAYVKKALAIVTMLVGHEMRTSVCRTIEKDAKGHTK